MPSARSFADQGPICAEGLRAMRRALGMTARELAALLDVGAPTFSQWQTREPNPMAFLIVGSMVLDAAEGRTTTRDRLLRLRRQRDGDELRAAIVRALRPFAAKRRELAANARAARELGASSPKRTKAELRREYDELPPSARRRYDALVERANAGATERAEEERQAHKARAAEIAKALAAVDARLASAAATKRIEAIADKVRAGGAIAAAAELGWFAGIEERAVGETWAKARKKIEARYRSAAT